eukprot:CAMPEP_0168781896 /NCGR_PEP_ID=MMETSP0725-20121227/8878_1 /TAXON_ID=265536 /ORGANISM="Amphiprora sp., Strain CCMP467" /LENGTH=379 /DNA_ID=CAMNT_0008831799 /DNA_START=47 /DNA_END=1184 /DNA_ORIENTATION=+
MSNTGGASRLARANILELHPYRCARDDYSEGILLDANENAYGPPIKNQQQQQQNGNHNDDIVLERYPDPYQVPLKQKFASYRNVDGITDQHMFVGVGSDEAIDLLMRIFCKPGGENQIITTPPTYGMYKVCAKVNDIPIISVPLTPSFDVEVGKILDAMTPTVRLLFLCSPGNPTAKALPLSDIEAIVQSPKSRDCIVVVDEAYVDYSKHGTALSLILKYPNVVVLQTLSKAFGLAAIRCGFCFGSPDVIQLLNNVKAPYNLNALTSEMAIKALDHVDTLKETIQQTFEERDKVAQALTELDFVTKVFPSDANFLLFQMKSHALESYKHMADNFAVISRYRGSELHCSECIRVTVGTPEENEAFLKALKETYAIVSAKK